MSATLIRLPVELCSPLVYVLDNTPTQVKIPLERLEATGYLVRYFQTSEPFFDGLRSEVPQAVLIDVALHSDSDSTGLDVGERCLGLCPDALRLCISRDTVTSAHDSGPRIMRALNPDVAKGGVRLFDGFGDKADPEQLLMLLHHLRGARVGSDAVEVHVDEEISASLGTVHKKIANENKAAFARNIPRQIIEVVKQLARRSAMPDPRRIELRTIGNGRSRTVVYRMSVSHGDGPYPPIHNIVKLGGLEMVRNEISNYECHLPRFLAHGSYPHLEARGESRDVAGLAYGRLGDGTDVTLHGLYRKAALTNPEVLAKVERVFRQLVDQEPSAPVKAQSLLQVYEKRFRALAPGHRDRLNSRFISALKPLFDRKLVSNTAGGLCCGKIWNSKLESLATAFVGDVGFAPYQEAVVHGDLHFENILLPGGAQGDPYLIDFAHTQPDHLFLDPVLLELACRFQLGMAVLTTQLDTPDLLYEKMLALEWKLARLPVREGATINTKDVGPFAPTEELISGIRGQAARRSRREAHNNYFAGVGLAAAAALELPFDATHDQRLEPILRTWFAITAMLNLTAFQWHSTNASKASLWKYEAGLSDDERVAAVIRVRADALRQRIGRWVSELTASDTWEIRSNRLKNPGRGISSLLEVLSQKYPQSLQKLAAIQDEALADAEEALRAAMRESVLLALILLVSKEKSFVDVEDSVLEELERILDFRA